MTTLRPELLDELLADYERPEDLLGDDGLFRQLKKALLERALGAELTDHLGYEKGDPSGRGSGNSRRAAVTGTKAVGEVCTSWGIATFVRPMGRTFAKRCRTYGSRSRVGPARIRARTTSLCSAGSGLATVRPHAHTQPDPLSLHRGGPPPQADCRVG